MSAEEVAKAFVQHYYQTFDSNVDSLGSLFVRADTAPARVCAAFVLVSSLSLDAVGPDAMRPFRNDGTTAASASEFLHV